MVVHPRRLVMGSDGNRCTLLAFCRPVDVYSGCYSNGIKGLRFVATMLAGVDMILFPTCLWLICYTGYGRRPQHPFHECVPPPSASYVRSFVAIQTPLRKFKSWRIENFEFPSGAAPEVGFVLGSDKNPSVRYWRLTPGKSIFSVL